MVRASRVCAALAAGVLLLTGCASGPVDPWENYPLGKKTAYGVRSTPTIPILPIVEEQAGEFFVDNSGDTFEDDVISVCNSSYEIPQKLEKALYDTMAEYKFRTSFYVIDLETRMSFGYNVDEKFDSASTVKCGYALYLTHLLQEGKVTLGDILEYKEQHYAEGSGSTQYSVFGTLFTLKAIYYRMIYNSDNVAYYMLTDYTGVDGYNELLRSLGSEASITAHNRWPDFSPRDLASIWDAIWEIKDTDEYGELLWTYLTTNLYNEFEVAMPEYKGSAHKSGWSTTGYHESGIVNGRRRYICVVMTKTGYKNDCLHRTIRNIDNIMCDYDLWLKSQASAK